MYVSFTEGDRHLSIVTSNNIVDNTGEMTSTIHPVLDDYNSENSLRKLYIVYDYYIMIPIN